MIHRTADDQACQRLVKIPDIGPVTETAVIAAIGNGAAFRKGREFAAWMGVVPREHCTGGKQKLLGISKRGNSYYCTKTIRAMCAWRGSSLERFRSAGLNHSGIAGTEAIEPPVMRTNSGAIFPPSSPSKVTVPRNAVFPEAGARLSPRRFERVAA